MTRGSKARRGALRKWDRKRKSEEISAQRHSLAPSAQNIELCHENGNGTGQTMTEAVRLYRLFIEQKVIHIHKIILVVVMNGKWYMKQ